MPEIQRNATVTCLVIMPFGSDFDEVFAATKRAAESASNPHPVKCYWLKDLQAAGRITDDIVNSIQHASMCIADVTANNANVMWETGYSMALGRPTVLIGQDLDKLPFDLKVHRVLSYRRSELDTFVPQLRAAVEQTIERYGLRPPQTESADQRTRATTVVVTGSMQADPKRAQRRVESLLSPYLGKGSLWYCGTFGVADYAALRFLLAHDEHVAVVGYGAGDISRDVKEIVESYNIEFIDASVESADRDRFFLSKADLMMVFWNGTSQGTSALIDLCYRERKSVLVGLI